MTSWILPEKEKPPSVDSDFSCIVLTVYKLTRNDFHSNTADVVHPLHPQHLIFRKRGLPLRPLFRKAILPAEKTLLLKQCLRLWFSHKRFTSLQTYKVLKQTSDLKKSFICFAPLQTYKVLKHLRIRWFRRFGFAPLQTYKVLKHLFVSYPGYLCFAPLQTYKVLKLTYIHIGIFFCFAPLQTYKVLKLASELTFFLPLFCTITNLQGSQT